MDSSTQRNSAQGTADGTTFLNGLKVWSPLSGLPVRRIFVATATGTVSNTTTETTLIGSGVGSLTLPANLFAAGLVLRVHAAGVFGSQAIPIGLRLRLKKGSTVLLDTGVQIPAGLLVARLWELQTYVTGRSATTVMGHGLLRHMTAAIGAPIAWEMSNGTTAVTIGSGAEALDLTATWAVGVAALDTISCTNFEAEVVS